MKGVLGGILAGAVVSVAVAVGLSVMVGPPQAPAPEVAGADVPAGSGFAQGRDDEQAELPGSAPVAAPGSAAPQMAAPEPDSLASLSDGDTDPGAAPVTGAVGEALAAPAPEGAASPAPQIAEAAPEEPVLPSPQAEAPEAPTVEEAVAAPDVPASDAPQGGENMAEKQTVADVSGGADAVFDAGGAEPAELAEAEAAAPPQSVEAPADMAADQAADGGEETSEVTARDLPAAVAGAAEQPQAAPLPEAAQGGEGASVSAAEAAPDAAPSDDVAAAPAAGASQLPQVAARTPEPRMPGQPASPGLSRPATPEAEDGEKPLPLGAEEAAPEPGRPSIGTPAARLADRGAVSTRLPLVGQGGAGSSAEGTEKEKEKPVSAYAAKFDNPEDKPLMSIVLIDRGDSKIGLEALSAFPYPLSFAVDVTRPDASAAMETYRKAGFEVLALADLPAGATARDAETLLNAGLAAVPEAVAVMEGDAGGLQPDRAVSEQVAGILAQTGHGLLLFPKGLNTGQKMAAKEGVPSAAAFRDFDAKGQDPRVIRRFLDQAAFRAKQEDGVVMVGRLRPDTISALLLWGLQDRASSVALAPVSQLLKAE